MSWLVYKSLISETLVYIQYVYIYIYIYHIHIIYEHFNQIKKNLKDSNTILQKCKKGAGFVGSESSIINSSITHATQPDANKGAFGTLPLQSCQIPSIDTNVDIVFIPPGIARKSVQNTLMVSNFQVFEIALSKLIGSLLGE